jgi:hypothetical protein
MIRLATELLAIILFVFMSVILVALTAERTLLTIARRGKKMVLHEWKRKYPDAVIQGHKDFPNVNKACPSFDAKKEYAHIK